MKHLNQLKKVTQETDQEESERMKKELKVKTAKNKAIFLQKRSMKCLTCHFVFDGKELLILQNSNSHRLPHLNRRVHKL